MGGADARFANSLRARCALGFGSIVTLAARRITCSRLMAFIDRRAGDWVSSFARAQLTSIRFGAGIIVIAWRTIGLGLRRAHTQLRDARVFEALIAHGAGGDIATHAIHAESARACTCRQTTGLSQFEFTIGIAPVACKWIAVVTRFPRFEHAVATGLDASVVNDAIAIVIETVADFLRRSLTSETRE